MAYQFQSWNAASVATAADVSQIEINIRDHVHGVSGVASIPYRTLIPAANAYVRDEFLSGIYGRASGALAGELGWSVTETYGTLTATRIAGHPGVAVLSSGAATNNYSVIQLQQNTLEPTDYLDTIYYFKVPSVTAVLFRIGFPDGNPIAPTDGLYFEKLSTDTNWFAVARAASTETRVDMGSAVAIETWYKLRVRRIDATTIGYSINGGTETTITTNIPTAGLCAAFAIRTVENVNKYYHIDYFDLLITGLSR